MKGILINIFFYFLLFATIICLMTNSFKVGFISYSILTILLIKCVNNKYQ